MTVALVGAGPGDPELITVRGLRLVQNCDVLVVDRLVADELVGETRRATVVRRDPLGQAEVNELLVHHGRRGLHVVRLKGGDPFVFGRGWEEIEALEAAGVPWELVPGVSNLVAAPGLAGIPLTHRGVSAEVTVITGTSGRGAELDYARLARTPGTLVVFMGLGRLPQIAAALVEAGRPADEPAAVVSRASLPDQRVVTGTLATIAARAAGLPSPALIVVGGVVAVGLGAHAGLDDALRRHVEREANPAALRHDEARHAVLARRDAA
jgi:uroporphyrin-III C-methyltransferase